MTVLDDALDLGVAELGLGLPLELRLLDLHVQHAGQALPDVLPRQGEIFLLENSRFLATSLMVRVERRLESGEVGAASGC